MKGAIIGSFIALFSIAAIPNQVLASDGGPVCGITFKHTVFNLTQDTIPPPPKKNTENSKDPQVKDDQPVAKVIKVIPKARRQPIPLPVKVNVKPVKIIKPTIIRPLIKVLH